MKSFTIVCMPLLAICLLGASSAANKPAARLSVMRADQRPTIAGPPANFTGNARIDRQVRPDESARVMGSLVSFEAGARTAWHTHPLGQTLVVTRGCGWVQSEGSGAQEILPGDVVWIPANTRHWHGAQANQAMSHYAIVEPLNSNNVTWMEQVSVKEYGSAKGERCTTP
jgi:quercetin dioxygenase-like cupin family protein